jgi:hypothetical protein
MGTAVVTLPDGRKARITFESQGQLDAAIAELEQAPAKGGVGRQLGLTARYAAEGLAALPASVANAPAYLLNKGAEMIGSDFRFPEQNQAVSDMLTKVGLPSPETPGERVVGDASRLLAGAGGAVGTAGRAAKSASGPARSVLNSLAARADLQAAGAVGAGAAGGATREAGGGPGAQFAASVAGGLTAPAAYGAARGAVSATAQTARKLVAPKDVEATVKLAFERAGIDWNAISKQARAAIVKDAEKAVYRGEPISTDALRRLADYRNIGATPLVGDITQNPRALTLQRNLAKQQSNTRTLPGGPDLPAIDNQNARRVIGTLEGVADSPLDTYATGGAVINRVRSTDAALRNKENALYRAARDSSGRQVPLDRGSFVDQAWRNLENANRAPWLPSQVKDVLNTLSKGEGKFDVDTIDSLKTLLAQESRATTNGNVKAAISAVRDALENVQPAVAKTATGSPFPAPGQVGARVAGMDAAATGAADDSLKAFDQARRFARSRREWQESAKFIEDALDGADADNFVKKHIIGGSVEELSKLNKTLGADKTVREAVRKQFIEHILSRGRADGDTVKFSSAGMSDALKQIGDRKLALFFNKQEISQIRSAVNVARYMQSQPIGSAVNNSNTASTIAGKLWDVLLKGGGALPLVGPWVADPLTGATISVQGRQVANVGNALIPSAPRQSVPVNPLILAATVPPRDD